MPTLRRQLKDSLFQECGYINVFEIVEVFGSVAAEEAAAAAAEAAKSVQPSADQPSSGAPIMASVSIRGVRILARISSTGGPGRALRMILLPLCTGHDFAGQCDLQHEQAWHCARAATASHRSRPKSAGAFGAAAGGVSAFRRFGISAFRRAGTRHRPDPATAHRVGPGRGGTEG
jgi:hypothetical protein